MCLSFIRAKTMEASSSSVYSIWLQLERRGFTIGVPVAGEYERRWNTEMREFGGVWKQNNPHTHTQPGLWKDYQQSLTFTCSSFGASIWKLKRKDAVHKKR